MNDLHRGTRRLHVKTDGALHAVQIVVDAAARGHKEGRADARQIERLRKIFLKGILYLLDGKFGLYKIESGLIHK